MKTVKTNSDSVNYGSMVIDKTSTLPELLNEPVVVIGDRNECLGITDRGFYGLNVYKESREIEEYFSSFRTVDEINDYILENHTRPSFMTALDEMGIINYRYLEDEDVDPRDKSTLVIDIDYDRALSYVTFDI